MTGSFARFAVKPEALFKIFPAFRLSEEEKKVLVKQRTAAIAGLKIARRLDVKPGDRVPL